MMNPLDILQLIMNRATVHADNMEGANHDEFLQAEARMCECIDILEACGVRFNPMTGESKPTK